MDCEVRSERDHNFRPRAATEWGTRSAVARGDVGEIQGEDGRLRVAGEGSHKTQTTLHKLQEFSLAYKNMLSVGREASPFTSTHFEPIRDDGAVFNPYDV